MDENSANYTPRSTLQALLARMQSGHVCRQ